MRNILLFSAVLAIGLVVTGCGSTDLRFASRGDRTLACLQCSVACAEGDNCSACKGNLRTTDVARACPRCTMVCGGRCPACRVRSVPALQYYRCPGCGKTAPAKGGGWGMDGPGSSLPGCPGCGRKMRAQTVPLRAYCADCGIWSVRVGPCPRCGIDLSPM